MPRELYVKRNFSAGSMELIDRANQIIATYTKAGYLLTLRQLYYQFVSRDYIANKVSEYKRLGSVVNDARLAGLIDWNAIEDRTRNIQTIASWGSPANIIESAADGYAEDKWADQPYRVEVWIEKEALAGVFARVCAELAVPYFSCRGYTSQSEMWAAGKRLQRIAKRGATPVVLHFGDPSGIDMTRDIVERLAMFARMPIHVDRLALNMAQVEEYEPPPNPAKESDSRFANYLEVHGDESWELDALEPTVLADLVRKGVEAVLDVPKWNEAVEREEQNRALLTKVSANWERVANFASTYLDDE